MGVIGIEDSDLSQGQGHARGSWTYHGILDGLPIDIQDGERSTWQS